jgi:hypothetical protein
MTKIKNIRLSICGRSCCQEEIDMGKNIIGKMEAMAKKNIAAGMLNFLASLSPFSVSFAVFQTICHYDWPPDQNRRK